MKYKVGDKTLLGEIVTASMGSFPYLVDGRWRYTESEIDAIIIKPKRNIDHLADLWDNGEINKAVEFFNEIILESKIAVIENVFAPYIEPSKYPKLTPEELKAVKWLVDGGFYQVESLGFIGANTQTCKESFSRVCHLPLCQILAVSSWMTEKPINLKELLDAQEGI